MEREAAGLKSKSILEKRKSVEKDWQLRKDFLTLAVKKGADLQRYKPENSPSWTRKLEIVDDINFTSVTEASVAREQGVDRRAIHQLYTKGMRGIWNNLNEEDRRGFPWEFIKSARKTVSLDKRRENSIARGGGAVLVEEAFVHGGARSQSQFEEITGLSGTQLVNARGTVREWGYAIPKRSQDASLVKNALDKARTDRQKRRILNESNRRGSLLTAAARYPETFTKLKTVLENAGFHVAPRSKAFKDIQSLIRSSGISMCLVANKAKGRLIGSYNILLRQDESRIADLLNNDPKLAVFKENPVKRIPVEDGLLPMPSYSDLIDEDKFGRLSLLAKQAGIRFGVCGNKIVRVKDVFEGCPVSLYCYAGGKKKVYYYQKPQEQQIVDFLAGKYGLTDALR